MRFQFVFILAGFLLIGQFGNVAIAQPANDDCNFAQTIVLPPSGEICIQSSNLNATPDGIFNGCNGPTGGNEVWFSYVAHGLVNTITAYPINAPGNAQQLALTIPDGNCTNPVINTCAAAAGPNDTVSVTWNFAPGTTVWFEVTALLGDGDFEVCIQSWNPQPAPGSDCASATRICNKQSFLSADTTFGTTGIQPSCFPLPVDEDVWYKFSVSKTGTVEWTATPFENVEFDWAMYDITGGCPGVEVACNYTVGGNGSPIGMSPASPGCLFSNFCPPITVTQGSTYAIVIDKFNSPLGNGFKMEWGGTFEMVPSSNSFELTPSFACDSATVAFIDSSYGAATYTWNFGNGNTSSSVNPAPQFYDTLGNYLVSLVLTDSAGFGCSSVTSRDISILQAPSDSIYGDTTVCVGQNANLFYGGVDTVNTSFIWNFDGGTVVSGAFWGPFVVNWATPGIKKVTLQVTDVVTGCTSVPDTFEVNVIGTPVTTFSVAPSACIGQNVQIIFTGTAGPTATFNWNFGTATVVSGTGAGPYIITYATAGNYSITLDIVDGNCPPALPTTNNISVSTTPTATFTLPNVSCQNQSNLITYTGNASPAAMYTWNFGGGTVTSGSGQGPYIVEYPVIGTFYVTLTVTENGCTSASFSDSILVNFAPTASYNISSNQVCGADSVIITFTGVPIGPTGIYNWNFGTANVISGANAGPFVVNFPNTGWNVISLSVSENGCSSLIYADSVNVGFQPTANAGIDQSYCTLDSVQIGEAQIFGYTYSWTPASGLSNSGISNPWVNVLNIGVADTIIPFILTVDSLFCSDRDTVDITVRPNQLTNIIANSGQCFLGNSFTFINGSPQIIGATYNWDFGPNATPGTSTVINPSPITFNTVGTQTVILNASANGCPSISDTFRLEIYPMPVADFISDKFEGCPPLLVQFTDVSTADTGSTYNWGFGSGQTSNIQNPLLSFSQPGMLDVSLIVETSFGCKDTMLKTNFIDVWIKPSAGFIAEPPNTNIFFPNIDFTNNSGNGITCFYDFDDGFTTTACDVSHTFADTGTYCVTFITTNNLGCADTAIQKIRVDPFYTFYAPNAFTPNADLLNDIWVWQGSNITQFELRVFNRWGQLVYETDNFFGYWNGRWQNEGDLVQDGVYIYEVLLREGTGRQRAFGGYVSVLK